MAFLKLNDGAELYYEVHGNGPPLLFVSGLGGTAAFWTPHIEFFAKDHTVILHDHRGTGTSTPSEIDYSVEQMADDVIQLMDALDVESADFVGHSTGGAIGQVIALDHPARLERLVLSATWAGYDPYFDILFKSRRQILLELGAVEYMRSLLMVAFPPDWIRDNYQAVENIRPEDAAARVPTTHCGVSRIDAILTFDRRPEVTRIAAPTLVMCTRDDMVTPAYLSEELAAAIPGAELEMLDRGGHFYTTSRPQAFQAKTADFLK